MNKILTYLSLAVIFLASCSKEKQPTKTQHSVPPPPHDTRLSVKSISTSTGNATTVVTITGDNFNPTPSGDTVKFNGVPATVQSATDTTLVVTVPNASSTGAITVTTSGGTVTGPVFTYGPNVYLAGYAYNSAGIPQAMYWKNGNANPISGFNNPGQADAMTVVYTNVYISGMLNNSAGDPHAAVWKNGAGAVLFEGSAWGEGYSIAVSGSDVYVGGYMTTDPPYNQVSQGVYWKDGTINILTNGPAGSAQVNAITVSGGDVYAAGMAVDPTGQFLVPTYWKNGVATAIPAVSGSITGIAVSGNDVYITGLDENGPNGTEKATYWKNGTAVHLTDGSNALGAGATAIAIVGNDIYVAGYQYNAIHTIAMYWKNGVGVALTDGNYNAAGNSISVVGNDVYVGGYESNIAAYQLGNPIAGFTAKYWKNGVPVVLTNGFYPSAVNAIVVK